LAPRLKPAWAFLEISVSRTLLVTGGAGFIGSNFVRRALSGVDGEIDIVNLDKLTYAGNLATLADIESHPGYTFVHGDIADGRLLADLFAARDIDAVVHFAAESHVDRSIESPEQFLLTNVLGSFRLLEAARQHWKKLPTARAGDFRFLHVSTDEVYGTLGPTAPSFSETTPFSPNSPYAASKASSDHFARAYFHTYGLPVVTTNCSNNYGPYQFPEKLIPLMILNALDGKRLPIYGDGDNIRDWLYVGDHCAAVARVLAAGCPGETYNIGGNHERTNLQIVDTLCATLDRLSPRADGRSYREQKTFVTDRPGHDRRYAINSTKLQHELGWAPAESFESGLEKTVAWYLGNRAWCERVSADKYQRERLGLAKKA
jgi:dTDP-glucose 4,6-dehydratase